MSKACVADFHCPNCGRYLATAAGFLRVPPCRTCGTVAERGEDGQVVIVRPPKRPIEWIEVSKT